MELGIRGKVAIVTGASKGIGRAIALALAAEGCKVVISARGIDDLRKVEAEITALGSVALAVAGDATSAADNIKLVDETVNRFGTVHILVNNAGGADAFSSFEELTDDDWLKTWNLNVMSTIRMVRAALPHMQAQKWGRIINISSESAIQPDPFMPHYNASKAALNNLTKSLSKAYGKDGILVNTVSPAFIKTPLVEGLLRNQAKEQGISEDEAEQHFLKTIRPNIVLGRAGNPEETAGIVVFLASDQASFITGSNFRVDGGSVASV